MGWLTVSRLRRRGVHSSLRHGFRSWLRELVWPSMGWKALFRLLLLKLRREAEHPHKVAFGVALGVGVSFLPFPFIGVTLAVLLAWALRASIAAALIGQIVGNPWTFPLIWWSTYGLGRSIWPGDAKFSWVTTMQRMDWHYFWSHIPLLLNNIVLPLIIGGVLIGGTLALLTYVIVYREILRIGKKKKKAVHRG